MRVVRHIREAKITHHILIYIEPKYYHIIKPDKMIGRELVHSMDACFCSALMASRGVSFMSAHPDSSIIVFVNVSSKTSSCSTRKQANDIHMVVEIFCRITLNSTVGDKRHPRLFSSRISLPHQSCLPRQRHMEIMRKKFRFERLLMNAVCSSLKNAHLSISRRRIDRVT